MAYFLLFSFNIVILLILETSRNNLVWFSYIEKNVVKIKKDKIRDFNSKICFLIKKDV